MYSIEEQYTRRVSKATHENRVMQTDMSSFLGLIRTVNKVGTFLLFLTKLKILPDFSVSTSTILLSLRGSQV